MDLAVGLAHGKVPAFPFCIVTRADELTGDLDHHHAPVVLLVAHPDDEIIGVGGQLSSWPGRLLCVHATSGSPADGADAARAGFGSREAYATARRHESERALAIAGLPPTCLLQLPFVDQSLAWRLDDLTIVVESLLQSTRPAAVITHAYEGGHPDHDAVSLAVATALARWPPERGSLPRRLEFAGYHEGDTGELVTNGFGVPRNGTERRIALDAAHRRQKTAMFACFDSQREVLCAFGTDEEWLREAPQYDYSRPPNGGRVWYDRFHWGIDSATWCRRAADCLAQLRATLPC